MSHHLSIWLTEESVRRCLGRNRLTRAEPPSLGLLLRECGSKYRDGTPHSGTVIDTGDRQRTMVLSGNARTPLHQRLRHRKSLLLELLPGAEREAVWIIPAGARKGKRLSTAGVRKFLKRYDNFATIQRGVHPHLLRHTFATERFGAEPGSTPLGTCWAM